VDKTSAKCAKIRNKTELPVSIS